MLVLLGHSAGQELWQLARLVGYLDLVGWESGAPQLDFEPDAPVADQSNVETLEHLVAMPDKLHFEAEPVDSVTVEFRIVDIVHVAIQFDAVETGLAVYVPVEVAPVEIAPGQH